jgi:hypothetical protein
MQTSNANQVSRSKNYGWYLLGEYSLVNLSADAENNDQRTGGLLFKTVREMGIPLDRIEPVEMALNSFTREALRRIQLERDEHPVQIRIYCQKKIIDEEMKGGWGYFMIIKPKDASFQDDLESQDVIDFYIYEEGQ